MALAGLALGLAASLPLAAEEGKSLSLGGSFECLPSLVWTLPEGGEASLSTASTTSLLLDLAARSPGGLGMASVGASLEASVFTGVAVDGIIALAASGRLPADVFFAPDPDEALLSGAETMAALRIRTAWAKLDWGWASASSGRQVIKYGRGALWSPVDIFSSLEESGISTTRRGIDALRIKAPLGATGLLDLVASPERKAEKGSYCLRLSSLLVSGLDAGVLGAWKGIAASNGNGDGASNSDEGAWMAGGDFKLDLGASFYGEALYSQSVDGGSGLLRAAGGADWSLGDFVFAAEYYWNGGVAAAEDPYAAGEHNLYGGIAWRPDDLTALDAAAVWVPAEAKCRLSLVAARDVGQGATLSLFAIGAFSASTSVRAGMDLAVKF